jgi:hypothetical protein
MVVSLDDGCGRGTGAATEADGGGCAAAAASGEADIAVIHRRSRCAAVRL